MVETLVAWGETVLTPRMVACHADRHTTGDILALEHRRDMTYTGHGPYPDHVHHAVAPRHIHHTLDQGLHRREGTLGTAGAAVLATVATATALTVIEVEVQAETAIVTRGDE